MTLRPVTTPPTSAAAGGAAPSFISGPASPVAWRRKPRPLSLSPRSPAMTIRDRITAFRRIPARDLRPNPYNWRTHSREQQRALEAVLAEIGYAGALLARELP